ncbi:MAG: aminopeptidase [Anaerolineales bacterium]
MSDPRLTKLADVLVDYSTAVKPGEWVQVYYHPLAEGLAGEVYRAVLQAGGNPTSLVDSELLNETLHRYGSDQQLAWLSPLEKMAYEDADVGIVLMASENTRYLSSLDPEIQQKRAESQGQLLKILTDRTAAGDFRWVLTQYPCPAYAQDANMSLKDYEDFIFRATFADQDDPLGAWKRVHDQQQQVVDWLKGRKQVTVKSPNADLTLSIEGRDFINADGTYNMPSGEVYTSPVEDTARGWVKFTYPAINFGREVLGARFELEGGRVVSATAEKNQEFLQAILDTDEGARTIGEFAIGTNYSIQQFTGSILYDEKIGGSFHLAVGLGFQEIGGLNESAIHWDFICDIRQDSEIRVDGDLLYKNGNFVI